MAEDGEKKAKLYSKYIDNRVITPDGIDWKSDKYARFALYTFFINRLKGRMMHYKELGWFGNDDTVSDINYDRIIADHFDELLAEYKVQEKVSAGGAGLDLSIGPERDKNGNYKNTYYDLFKRELRSGEYNKMSENIITNRKQIAADMGKDIDMTNPVVSIEELTFVLSLKQSSLEEPKREVVRKSVEVNDYISKKGDNVLYGGDAVRKEQAMELLQNAKTKEYRSAQWAEFGRGIQSLASLGVLGASVASFIAPPAGLLMYASIGVMRLASVGVGIASAILSKISIDKWREKRAKRKDLGKDRKHQKKGKGKYATTEEGEILSLKAARENTKLNSAKWKIYATVKTKMETLSMQEFEDWFYKFKKYRGAVPGTPRKEQRKFRKIFKALPDKVFEKILVGAKEFENSRIDNAKGEMGMCKRVLKLFSDYTPKKEVTFESTINTITDANGYFDKKIAAENKTINDLVVDVDALKRYEKMYKDSHAEEQYLGRKQKFADKVRDTLLQNLFKSPYYEKTTEDVSDAVNKDVLQEALKWGVGDDSSKIIDALEVVKREQNHGDKPFNYKIAASIENQLAVGLPPTQAEAKFIEACKEYGADDTEKAAIESEVSSIANAIANANSKQAVSSIDTSAVSNALAKTYLEEMKLKKTAMLKNDTSAVSAAIPDLTIASKVATLSFNKEGNIVASDGTPIEALATAISSSSTIADKKAATDMLNSQIAALECESRQKARAGAIDCLKNSSFNGSKSLKDIIDEIGKVNFENINEQSTKDLYEKFITKLTPDGLSKYFVSQYLQRIEKAFTIEINKQETQDSLDKIIEVFKKMAGCDYLSNAQRARLKSKLDPYIVRAVNNKINAEKDNNFIDSASTSFDSTAYSKLLNNTTSDGGLSDILDDSTTDRILAKNKLKFLSSGQIIREAFKMDVNGFDLTLPRDESRKVSELLLDVRKDRKITDDLFMKLNEIKEIYTNSDLNYNYAGAGDKTITGSYFENKVKGMINSIKGLTDNDDKYIALIALKKAIMGQYMASAYSYLAVRAGSPDKINNYLSDIGHKNDFNTNFYNKWVKDGADKGIIALIDEELNKFSADYSRVSATNLAKLASESSSSQQYVSGHQMVKS